MSDLESRKPEEKSAQLSSSEIAARLAAFGGLNNRQPAAQETASLVQRASEERYRDLIDALPAAVYTTDAEGWITLYNQAAAQLWGRAPRIGKDRWCGSYRIYTPQGEPLPHDRCPMATAVKQGREITGAEILVEREDGARCNVLAHPRPIRDGSGAVIGAINMLVDITERKRGETEQAETKGDLALQVEALTRLHQLALTLAGPLELDAALQAILEALVEVHGAERGILWLHDPATKRLRIAASMGFDEAAKAQLSELSVRPETSLSTAAFVDRRRAVIEDLDSDPRFHDFLESRRVIGYRAINSTPILTRDGAALGSITLYFKQPRRPAERELQFADLCARYAAETLEAARIREALRESEQKLRDQAKDLEQQLIASGRLVSLGEVTASMAHEFNNPLGIILGFVDDLLAHAEPTSRDHRALAIIKEESVRCKKIVEDLMEYAKPRSNEMALTDVSSLIEKTLALVEARLYKQKIEVAVEADKNLPAIQADSQQLTQVLVNLYLNAIDAMPKGGKLKVSARAVCAGESIVVSIADTGLGMEESMLGKIFQPFFTAKKRRGLGLGLPICARIVKNHGGTIEVQSQPGQGTTFEMHLPADPAPEVKCT